MANRLLTCLLAAALLALHAIPFRVIAAETEILMLSGTGSDDTVDWEFKVNGGRNADKWSSIPVPSNWEMQGFGTYHYWEDWNETPAPDSLGQYRHRFTVPESWENKSVSIVIGAAMTDAEVRINGVSAGPAHQGGFYQFSYNITDLLKFGEENLLEVDVQKYSSNESVNLAERQADYWLFGGIFRPVWLEAKPAAHIDRIAVDARHDGSFTVDLFLSGLSKSASVSAEVFTLQGKRLTKTKSRPVEAGQTIARISGTAKNIEPWSAEWPNLYQLRVTLRSDRSTTHSMDTTIGFRTIELRPKDGFYLNGQKIILKGANRHSIWPSSGRATNASLSEADVKLMKEMNMNAVRMSHYPPDTHFLEACGRLGLYVINELGGWQKSYDSEVGPQLVRETVTRDVNHPSIIIWANGNEGGWNTDLDDDFALYDPQKRPVIHPWHNFGGINTSHYENFDSGPNWFFHGEDLIMPTEFLHGLYDGGHGAGLNDWWKRIQSHPLGLGGFLWAFADEGIVREDQDGAIDVAGNRAPDGIVGPYREKEGSFYTIKEIWAPIYLPRTEVDTLPPSFDGRLRIENRFSFTNIDQLSFNWKLLAFLGDSLDGSKTEIVETGRIEPPSVAPLLDGFLEMELPDDWANNDALTLSAHYPDGREIYTWSWMLSDPSAVAERLLDNQDSNTTIEESTAAIVLRNGSSSAVIDRSTGMLSRLANDDFSSPLKNGPILLSGESELQSIDVENGIVVANYDGPLKQVSWELLSDGWLKLDYTFFHRYFEPTVYFGVSFDYDETQVSGARWLGKGPYRVWKNRKKGAEFGIWQKAYNDTVTGASWAYPEFKGFHDDVYWAQLQSDATPLEIVIASPDINLRLFTPSETEEPANTHVDFPAGDLSFLHSIAPIGTKFKPAAKHGPEGQPSWPHRGGQSFSATIFFRLTPP
ncbi:glycoside hydrolase family 2 TIM barrel-domain containing protein [Pelagicoccus sp. SDUM812003]|uniref:glycoside hydrolase family 2 protein n=1 Tax=Pelagicoccus sp. SDUM812003 TaxID=3041267 RepID=UPI00280EC215|nr:glycoside hydrolase family 2 TIM barrel-domain containing protein [Pelagicoccus sp. SDUM812003]MDQ8202240.1 glycoside hydrolase family 2 TIM barrel-domain containing protein [Pelagicoccus sp. SDUM812003]